MKKSKLSFKMLSLLFVMALSFLVGLTTLDSNIGLAFNLPNDNTKFVKVEEIWDDNSNEFNAENLITLLKYVSGDENFSMLKFSELYNQAEGGKTAQQIREGAPLGKTNQQDVVVTYGGKDWTVTYLSLDKKGDVILTLWLADIEKNVNEAKNGNVVGWLDDEDRGMYSRSSSANDARPDALYGTSYIRAVVLNNGGSYNGWSGSEDFSTPIVPKTTEQHADQKEDAVFARFTYDMKDTFLDYIDSPRDVAWQENGEYAQQILSFEYNLANEMWSDKITNDGFSLEYEIPTWEGSDFSSGGYTEYNMNMATKNLNAAWADDKLWLPSMSEIGYCRGQSGLWKTTMEQRAASEDYFTRTMKNNSTNHVYAISSDATCYVATQVVDTAAVRPALHLNISKALKTAGDDVVDISVKGSLKDGDLFDESKLTVFALYANGFKNTVTDEITFTGYETETPLVAGQTITIEYGGHTTQYTVLQTTLTNAQVTLRSQVGFDANVKLNVDKYENQDEIKRVIGDSWFQQLGGVESLYKISAKNDEVLLEDDSAVIKFSTKDFLGEYRYYSYVDGQLTRVYTDPSKDLNFKGTDITLVVVKVVPIGEQQPTTGGDVKPGDETSATTSQDTTGIILAFVFSMLVVICSATVLLLIFGRKNRKNK